MMDADIDCPSRVCVVIPTYNNCSTIGELIGQVMPFVPDIIVVDDGSTDETPDVLAGCEGITVVTQQRNGGKGRALAGGLDRAIEAGFTHVITLDADGQHRGSDLPKFLDEIALHSDAIIVGVRDLKGWGRRLKSRVLRVHSNFWVWLETGRWIGDTQSGYRGYPLSVVAVLKRKCDKYDFDVEVLVRAAWTGTPVRTVPVRVDYGPGSESHFRPLRDFALVGYLHLCLMLQRLMLLRSIRDAYQLKAPPEISLWRQFPAAIRRSLVVGCDTPVRFASTVGLGIAMGILPIWGFQMAAAAVLAHLLRLSKPLAVAASNISFPAAIPFILVASLMTGRVVLTGNAGLLSDGAHLTPAGVWDYAVEYLVGSSVLAVLAGLVGFMLCMVMAITIHRFSGKPTR